jgi:hypothetical protein
MQYRAAVERLCLHLRGVSKSDSFADDVSAEWQLYSVEQDLDSISSPHTDGICEYWKLVSDI